MGRRVAETIGLCHRCEHRAEFLETGVGSRYECQQTFAVGSCYMYQPVRGIVLARDKYDKRRIGDPVAISARAHGVGISPGTYVMRRVKGGMATYYERGKD